jgi:cation diffusion facilitator CzcD-associated flavoprotein CzcO
MYGQGEEDVIDAAPQATPRAPRTPRVAIIGAGLSGIGMACKLRLAGIETFRIYERRSQVGGTWWANQYPGLNCDVPSRSYQFAFAPNPDWSRGFAPGPEIWRYFDRVATEFGLRDRLSLGTDVTDARWEDCGWTVRSADGDSDRFDFVITATGVLVEPRRPDLPGLDTFAGRCFHSAEWEHDAALAGRRVAVIGNGSTGMQLMRALAGVASHVDLFQRTPQWIFPLPNRRTTRVGRWAMGRFPQLDPLAAEVLRVAAETMFGVAAVRPSWQRRVMNAGCHLHLRTVRDAELRRRFTPPDQPLCKRIVLGTGFYKLFRREDVELVDSAIERVTPDGITTADGVHHALDVIVLATGFHAHNYVRPMELVGPSGIRLSELWDGREPFGYRSVALPGFPNVFMLLGPNSPIGNQSLLDISQTQADFVMRCIERWRCGEVDAMQPTPAATERFNAELKQAVAGTIWASGCRSWYIGADGLPTVFPWTPGRLREILREPEPGDWLIERHAPELTATP